MKWLSLLPFLALSAWGEIIPSTNRIDWSAPYVVGVRGDIPIRTTIFANVKVSIPGTNIVAVGDGVADDEPALQAALNLCTSNQVVYVPAGTYRIANNITWTGSGKTLRGDGPTSIILTDFTADNLGVIDMGTGSNLQGTRDIASGYTKGSSNLVLFSATSLTVNKIINIFEGNDWFMRGTGVPSTNSTHFNQMAVITAISGTNITFWPPLVYTLKAELEPRIGYHLNNARMNGIENIKIECGDDHSNAIIYGHETSNNWLIGLDSSHASRRHVYLTKCVSWTITSNYVHEVFGEFYGPNSGPGVECFTQCAGMLIENNAFYRCWPAVMLEQTVGSVVAYNFSHDIQTGTGFMAGDINLNHSPHNMMNLAEGNKSCGIRIDGYHGSASHTTVFRCMSHTLHPTETLNQIAFSPNRWSYYCNVVGNIFGHPGFSGWYWATNDDYSYTQPTIYRVGYPNEGNNNYIGTTGPNIGSFATNDYGLDLTVTATLLVHGNYDYQTGSTIWDTNIVDQTIPSSLYLTNKPAWFGALTWPSYGPDVANLTNVIPAELRFSGSSIPEEPSNPAITNHYRLRKSPVASQKRR